MFKKNVGTLDRIVRIIVGIALIAAYFLYPELSWGIALLVVGIIVTATGLISSCLLYTILGLRTSPKE
ncbi:MAG: DUF2892 domain-containing protein [Alphaproteobacteria bacterium]|nr:DUF2892 domain-containing protein [Alphaproteobacteria bacterium]